MNQIRNLVREDGKEEPTEEPRLSAGDSSQLYVQGVYGLMKEKTAREGFGFVVSNAPAPEWEGLMMAGMTVSDVWREELEETSKSAAIQVLGNSVFRSAPSQDIDITPPDVTVIFRASQENLSEQLHPLMEAKGLFQPRGRVIEMVLLDKIIVSAGFFGGFGLLFLGAVFGIGFFSWMGVACLATGLVHILTK